MAHGGGGGEQKRGRKRVKNNSESAKKRRERSRNASAASYQGLRARDLGYGKPAQKAARKLAYELYGKGANGLTVGRQIREMLNEPRTSRTRTVVPESLRRQADRRETRDSI